VERVTDNYAEKVKRAKTEVPKERNCEELRDKRRTQYLEGKARYVAIVKKEKIDSF
jgi:hypothetical protein